jgi:hypothetical protein
MDTSYLGQSIWLRGFHLNVPYDTKIFHIRMIIKFRNIIEKLFLVSLHSQFYSLKGRIIPLKIYIQPAPILLSMNPVVKVPIKF